MLKLRILLPALAFAGTLHAQFTPLNDPANLAGERVSPQDPADTLPLNHGAPALQQLLAKLRTRASLMLIVAHPDDEDGGLLTYESRGQGARVAMLTLTRGEGGQNLMSADFDDALGLIRTQELLAADRYFGVDQFFGTEVDFGFSKTKEESFQKWTHDRVLYDAVRAVRLYRPLVIASVFVGGPTDGHGQHQVAGEIAQEVFAAAADPTVFPEMIAEGLLPWAPLKVYARVPFSRVTPEGMYDYATGKTIPTRFHNYVTGEDSTAVPSATVLIHEGDKPTDPTLAAAMGGDTFLQFARKGLALQKTQIGPNARLAPVGAFDAPYTLMATRLNCPPGPTPPTGCPTFATVSPSLRWASPKPTTEQSLFDGIDTSLPGIATLAPDAPPNLQSTLEVIEKQIAEAQRLFDPAHMERCGSLLGEAEQMLEHLIREATSYHLPRQQTATLSHELNLKRVQINLALQLVSKVDLSVSLKDLTSLPTEGGATKLDYTAKNESDSKALLFNLVTAVRDARYANSLDHVGKVEPNSAIHFGSEIYIPDTVPPTRPYFSRPNLEQPFYDISHPAWRNAPATTSPVRTSVEVFSTAKPSIGKPTFALDVVYPNSLSKSVVVEPLLSVSLSPKNGIVTAKSRSFTVTEEISTQSSQLLGGTAALELPAGWSATPSVATWRLAEAAGKTIIQFAITAPSLKIEKSFVIKARTSSNGHDYTESFRPVGYPGLPYTNFYTPATYRATAVDLHTAPNLHIAYLPGTGDPVPDFLPNLGITPTILTLKDLTPATLNKYDVILLGVRAYAALPALAGPGSQPLLDYAKQGGVVILQYNTARFGDAEAPFPIDVPGDPAHNVVEEAQPVTLLHPDAPLFTWPNRITSADFDGWVAERGHGFAASWSPQYQPLLETHDVGQDPQQGGLLLARTGKGAYIYCALALYRQLPEGVPGAYRLLANLLSYAKNPQVPR